MEWARSSVWLAVMFLICAQASAVSPSQRRPAPTSAPARSNKLLLMMWDGMRSDSVSEEMAGMKKMMDNGVHAHHLAPCYPTSSIPNHMCILTGQYAESHGLIGNDMYDKASTEDFKLDLTYPADKNPRWWKHVEPIWATAAKQGKRVRVYNWFGCEMKMNGFQLTTKQCIKYVADTNNTVLQNTVNTALRALADDELDFAAVYYDDPDEVQHKWGFNSSKARQVISDLDHVLLNLQMRAESLIMVYDDKTKLSEKLNVMLVSDHGHMNLTTAVNVTGVFEKYTNRNHVLTTGQQMGVWPDGDGDQIFEDLKQIKNMHVYRRDEIPEAWHYRGGQFVPPILCDLDPGFYFISPDQPSLHSEPDSGPLKSSHGYNTNTTEMQAIFLARGPNFQKGIHAPPVENIQLYQIMCSILEIKASTNNGTWSAVEPFIVDLVEDHQWIRSDLPVSFQSVAVTVVVAVSCVLVLTAIMCGIHYLKQRKRTKQYRTLPTNIDNESENDELDL